MRIPRHLPALVLLLSPVFLARQPALAQGGGHSQHTTPRSPAGGSSLGPRSAPRQNLQGMTSLVVPGGSRGEAAPTLHPDLRALAARSAQAGNSGSFNRVTTNPVEVLSSLSPAARVGPSGATSATARMANLASSLHPYSSGAIPAGNSAVNSHLSAGSSWHQQPQRQVVEGRSQRHNYYPGMRSGLSHVGRGHGRGHCTLNRAHMLTASHHAR
jgi:hypothetical protein